MEDIKLDDWTAPAKDEIRTYLCQKVKPEPYKRIILLPADSCLDFYELLETGAIDSDTFVYAIERKPPFAVIIGNRLKEAGIKDYQVFTGEVFEAKPEGQFDFLFLDTCGQLSSAILNWLCSQVQLKRFTKDCKLYLAFNQYTRNGVIVHNKLKRFLTKTNKTICHLNPTYRGLDESLQKEQHRILGTVLKLTFGEVYRSWIYRNSNKGQPMHVFEFGYRQQNSGLSSIIKFLHTHTKETPEILTPGLRAAHKRYNLTPIKKVPLVKKETSTKPKIIDVVKLLEQRIASLETSILKTKQPSNPRTHTTRTFAAKFGYSTAHVSDMCSGTVREAQNVHFRCHLPKGWRASKVQGQWRIFKEV